LYWILGQTDTTISRELTEPTDKGTDDEHRVQSESEIERGDNAETGLLKAFISDRKQGFDSQ
jgi:hypothetical protein